MKKLSSFLLFTHILHVVIFAFTHILHVIIFAFILFCAHRNHNASCRLPLSRCRKSHVKSMWQREGRI